MSNESNSSPAPPHRFLSQRKWRAVGAVAIGLCAFMAWHGARSFEPIPSKWYLAIYWGVFLAALIVAMYVVILDIRYIRLMYALGQREIFENTLGSEEFRKALRARHERGNPPPEN